MSSIVMAVGMLVAGCSSRASSGPAGGTGPITFAADDPHGSVAGLVALWNAGHSAEQVRLARLPAQPAAQHATLLQNLASPSSGYDLVGLPSSDVAEFAAQGWLRPLTGRLSLDTAGLVGPAVAAASYQGKLFAAPWDVDAGVLYYRSDLVHAAPTSWKQLAAACPTARRLQIGCFAGQYAKGADLTANVVEAVGSAGGQLLRPDGSTGDLKSAGVRNGLQLLADSYRNGVIPKAALTYQASQASQAFSSGSLLFMRNWFSSYHVVAESGIKPSFALAVLPGATGPGASAIAGHSLGLPAGAAHPATALAFIRFLQDADNQRSRLENDGFGPVTTASYHDPAMRARFPQLAVLGQCLDRPAMQLSPDYPAISQAISDSGYAAISGAEPVNAAIGRLQQAIAAATG
ncbi:MAG: extracellular solute-binding protein [Jatrophihabitantaceae bacterium]